MKTRILSFFLACMLVVPAMTGCQVQAKMEANGAAAETVAESPKQSAGNMSAATSGHSVPTGAPALSLEEAQDIALKHAGLTADQVTALHTEYEIDHGVPQYDVEFHHGGWEYDYEIHADTGGILSYSRDD